MVKGPSSPPAFLDFLVDPELILGIQPISSGARIGVLRREHLDRLPAVVGRDHAAAFIGELAEPLLHDLLGEDGVKFGHRASRKRRGAFRAVAGANRNSGPGYSRAGRTMRR